ncbi:MAG: flagellar biosynthetic protein FliQ [Armatimonadota bacterium]
MQQALALDTARLALQTGLLVSLPILATSLFVGLLISLFQALTSIQEQTLVFVPKLFAVGLMTLFLGNWMLTTIISFVHLCFSRAAGLGLS